MILFRWLAMASCLALMSLGGVSRAATILEVVPGGVTDSASSWLAFDSFSQLPEEEFAEFHLEPFDFTGCIGATSCIVDAPIEATHFVVKAANFSSLYELAYPGETNVLIDVSEWDDPPIPGAYEFGLRWPNRGGNYPGIANVRALSPMPEPTSAVLFGVGSLLVGAAVRRRGRRSLPEA